jgi:hypothetical protein
MNKVAVVFGDGMFRTGPELLTKAAKERVSHLLGLRESEGITHVVFSGGDRTRLSEREVSEAFLMRRHFLRYASNKKGWFGRILLDETVGLANGVREVMTLLNQKELTQNSVVVIAQTMRLQRLAVYFRGLGWTEERVDYRSCPTRWETEKPCVQTALLLGALITPLGGGIASIGALCRQKLLTRAAPPPDIGGW